MIDKLYEKLIDPQAMLSTMNSHDEFIKRVKEKHLTNH